MKKKYFLLSLLFTVFLNNLHSQNVPSFYPFQGFHIGLTGQREFIQKCSYVSITGSDPAPRARWTSGWEVGMEFSYHFGKYFGIVAGINYGTTVSYKGDVFLSTIPLGNGEWDEVNEYDPSVLNPHETELIIPLKLEFHYPMYKNLFFMAETGVKIKGVFERLRFKDGDIGSYETYFYLGYSSGLNTPYYGDWGERNMGKISCDLLLGLGLYYKLPYGDLVRFSTGVNISFNNIIEGYYKYYLTESYGTFAVKNDFIYTQLSYIHTLNYKKAKRYLKSQGSNFSAKRERRKAIINLLNN